MTQIPSAGSRELLLWLLRRRRRVRVVNRSMLPLLQPGDELLIDRRAYLDAAPEPGDLVVLRHPRQPGLKLIKQVERRLPDGRLVVLGLNAAESSDSRHFGPILPGSIVGKITSRF